MWKILPTDAVWYNPNYLRQAAYNQNTILFDPLDFFKLIFFNKL